MRTKQFGWLAGVAALALLFLILGCSIDGEWWPLFNLFFLLVAALPPMFGSTESESIWGAIGDFIESVLFVSLFGYPAVLYHIGVLSGGALTLVQLSNVCIGVAIALVVHFNNTEYTTIF